MKKFIIIASIICAIIGFLMGAVVTGAIIAGCAGLDVIPEALSGFLWCGYWIITAKLKALELEEEEKNGSK